MTYERDLTTCERKGGPGGRDGVLPAAGESGQLVLVETPCCWKVEVEVRGGKARQGEEEGTGGVHIEAGLGVWVCGW